MTWFSEIIQHSPDCCAVRDESGCCCAPGQHMREDMAHFQRTNPFDTDEQIRERYWLAQWRTDAVA